MAGKNISYRENILCIQCNFLCLSFYLLLIPFGIIKANNKLSIRLLIKIKKNWNFCSCESILFLRNFSGQRNLWNNHSVSFLQKAVNPYLSTMTDVHSITYPFIITNLQKKNSISFFCISHMLFVLSQFL